MGRKGKSVKKVALFFGGFVVLLLVLIVSIPLFVNVDKYRPQIVDAANQEINGTLELGKLSLSLWGQIRVEVGGVSLKDSAGKEMVSVKDAYFHVPFTSIFSGSPSLTFYMKQPLLTVIKSKTGKLNLLTLMKEAPHAAVQGSPSPSATAPQHGIKGKASRKTVAPTHTPAPVAAAPSTPVTATPPAPTKKMELPGIAARARLGVELDRAVVSYSDLASGLKAEVKDLNLKVKDLSLSRPTELELWADLDTRLGKTFSLKGPARITAQAQPDFKDGQLNHVTLSANLDMDSVEMIVPDTFSKKKGIPTRAALKVVATEQLAKIESLSLRFHTLEITGQGTVSLGESAPSLNLSLKSNDIEFAPWTELIPMLKEFELGGKAKFEANASGPAANPAYKGNLSFSGLSAKAPMLKAQPKFDGMIHFITDQVDQIQITMKAPGNELKVVGKVTSFTKPNLNFAVASSGMDLDQLIDFNRAAKAKTALKDQDPRWSNLGIAVAQAEGTAADAKTSKTEDFDALLAPLRENKMMADIVANVAVDLKQLKAYQVKMSDVVCKLTLRDLVMGADPCSLKVFGGSVKAGFSMAMRPKAPTYQYNLQVSGLEIQQAAESQFALFKNTLTGRANFNMTGQGASLNPNPAILNLKAKGSMKVDQANFATMDIMKMVSEGLNKSIEKIADKVPAARGKTIKSLPSHSSKYEFISSDFTIADGKFTAPNFVAKAQANLGIDLRGSTQVGMKDFSLNTDWEVIDTYNLTGARDLSVEQAGVKVEHILAEGSSPVKFPIHAGCTIKEPCYSYTQVPEYLGKIALNNVTHALGERAKAEAKNQAEKLLKQAAPALENKLRGLFR